LLSSNDYLSISGNPEIINAQVKALKMYENALLMSGIFSQGDCPKSNFEKQMASFTGYEASVLCQSGWDLNVGLMQSIASAEVPVYLDFLAHMSLWEGVRAAGAVARPFLHNNMIQLEQQVERHGAGVIAVDSVYSTTGSIAPLEELVRIAEQYGCLLVVDESHSLGTHGPKGAGLVAELGLMDKVPFITASLAKTFAGRAGILACSQEFSEYFPYVSFPAIFSSTMLPAEIISLSKTLEIIRDADDRREQLFFNSNYLRRGLDLLGYDVSNGEAQIISLQSGTEAQTELLRDALEARNVFGAVFSHPATAKNKSMIRFSVNSGLSQTELDFVLGVCRDIRDEVNMWEWKSTKRKKHTPVSISVAKDKRIYKRVLKDSKNYPREKGNWVYGSKSESKI
jgi:CAI-1 autoinducer synthase